MHSGNREKDQTRNPLSTQAGACKVALICWSVSGEFLLSAGQIDFPSHLSVACVCETQMQLQYCKEPER